LKTTSKALFIIFIGFASVNSKNIDNLDYLGQKMSLEIHLNL